MEGRADLGEMVAGVGQLDHAADARLVGGVPQQSVIRTDEASADGGFDRDRATASAHSRIHHGDKDRTRRKITPTLGEHERPGGNRLGCDPVCNIDDVCIRRDRGDDALHHADIVVAITEVGQQRDRRLAATFMRNLPPCPALSVG